MKYIIRGFIIGVVSGLAFFGLLVIFLELNSTSHAGAFNHAVCQYPDRWSNPENGCDNSDPAVPECIKDMYSKSAEELCIQQYSEPTSVNDTNNATQPSLKAPITPVTPVVEIRGK